MGLFFEVVLGTAVIAVPQARLPLLAASVGTQVFKALGQRGKDDQAAEAEGSNASPVKILFDNVSCDIQPSAKEIRKGEKCRTLLDSVSGVATPGRLLALMGPSGSGKTTLLTALSGRVPRSKNMKLQGRVMVNGVPLSQSSMPIGYVPQNDMFYSQMTVRETLTITAALRLPKSATEDEREAAIEEVLTTLDLRAVADTIVGDKKTRGISGGEKKRLSIACELLSKPNLLFLDEPTTGLDAFQSLQVMKALKALTQSGHTIVASIHQPRSRIFDLFDDLLLLSNGKLLYSGAADSALAHFESLGHTCPLHHNPAEFLADIISIDNSTPEAAEETGQRFEKLVAGAPGKQVAAASESVFPGGEGTSSAVPGGPPLIRQVRMLFQRSWRQVSRDRATMQLRVATNVQSAVVFGCIWWRLRRLQISVNSRIGLLQVVAVYTAQTALFKTINLFAPEKQLVRAERTKGSYGAAPYFISKVLADLPVAALYPLVFSSIVYPMANLQPKGVKFLTFAGSNILEALGSTAMGMAVGALAPSTETALVLGPALTLIFVVFGGLYTNQSDVPRYLRWVPACSGIKNGYDTLCKNEFNGLELENEGPGSFLAGKDVLMRQGISGTVADSFMQQGKITLFYWWLTYCLLKADKPKYQPMLEPEA